MNGEPQGQLLRQIVTFVILRRFEKTQAMLAH